MTNVSIKKITDAWPDFSRFLFLPHNDEEYKQIVSTLDNLLDIVGEEQEHPLASLVDIVGALIEKYESENIPELLINNLN